MTDENTSADVPLPEYLKGLAAGRADMAGEISLLNSVIREQQAALRGLLSWRSLVNEAPQLVMKDMDDPDAIAVALFNGFVWDAAVKVMGHD